MRLVKPTDQFLPHPETALDQSIGPCPNHGLPWLAGLLYQIIMDGARAQQPVGIDFAE
jgi:hypothetical protein